jgi:hypothetical protein
MSQTEVQLIKAAAVVTADIADQAVSLDKLPHGTSSNNGKFLRANNGADPTFETVSTDLVADTSPQLGGDLDTNSFEITLDDAHKIKFGNGNDLTIQHSGNHAFIDNLTGNIYIRNDGSNDDSEIHIMARNDEESIVCHDDGAVDVYHNGGKKFSSHSNGLSIKNEAGGSSSSLFIFGPEGESAEIQMNADDGDDNADYFRLIHVASDNSWRLQNYGGGSWATNIEANSSGNVELYHNASKKLETTSSGATVTGTLVATALQCDTNSDISMDNGASGQVVFGGNGFTGAIALDGSNLNIYHNSSARGIQFGINETAVARFDTSGHFVPSATNTRDLGTTSLRWRNVYTNDLHLSNKGSCNDVDSTWGDWTIQEGESDLFLKNNRFGKKYKFNLTEVS